jgi:hypothetical protein
MSGSGCQRLQKFGAFALLLATVPFSAQAARPFFTDDARIVDKEHCQLETFYKQEHAYNGSEFWFLPACNPSFAPTENGVEITIGGNRIEDERNFIVQGKMLLKPLATNGTGFAASVGSFGGSPYVNTIASASFLDDRAVFHANLGTIRDRDENLTRWTWGVGAEILVIAPRLYAIAEMFGQRGETPTQHVGLRFWVIPNRFQIDASTGRRSAEPEVRFTSVGLRFLF